MRLGPFRDYDLFFPGQRPDQIDGELERLGCKIVAPERESAVQRDLIGLTSALGLIGEGLATANKNQPRRARSPDVTAAAHAASGASDAATSPAVRRRPQNRGGRPAKWDWQAFYVEVIRISDLDRFTSRDDLRNRMLRRIDETWGERPSPSVLRDRLSEISDALML